MTVSCSSAPPPKPDPGPKVESNHKMVNPLEDPDDAGDGLEVEGTLGQLDQHSIQEGIQPRLAAAASCFQTRVRRQPYLGGQVLLKFRIARDGAIKTLLMTRSSLGSVDIERCVVQELSRASFIRPRGGEAEFSYPMTFQGRVSPTSWDPGMVKEELLENHEALVTVKEGRKKSTLSVPRGLVLTFYVNRRGKVINAGMTAEESVPEEFSAPFIENLKKIKFEGPNSRYAKVTYQW